MDKPHAAYWSVIPADIRYHEDLSPNAKLFYAEITALANKSGYCWAGNDYFMEQFKFSERTVTRLISELEKYGYIIRHVIKDKDGKVMQRRIFLRESAACGLPLDNFGDTPLTKLSTPDNFGGENNIDSSICLNKKKNKKEKEAAAQWKPERFEGFWKFYPRKVNKAAARKAWDKLQPSDELIAEIGIKLKILMERSPSWKDAHYIPHASTFLNGARWNDVEDLTQAHAPPQASSAGGGYIEI